MAKAEQTIRELSLTRKDPETGNSNYPSLDKKITIRNYVKNRGAMRSRNFKRFRGRWQ